MVAASVQRETKGARMHRFPIEIWTEVSVTIRLTLEGQPVSALTGAQQLSTQLPAATNEAISHVS